MMSAARLDGMGGGARAGKVRVWYPVTLAVCMLGATVAGAVYGAPAAAALSRFWSEVMLPVFVTIYLNGIALCT